MCMLVFLLPILLQKNSTRESLSGQNQQSSLPSDTHTHTLWAQCGCVLHTDTPYFLAQDCVKPQGEGHQTEKHRRQIN